MDIAISKRKEYIDSMEYGPSFSLGLTQEFSPTPPEDPRAKTEKDHPAPKDADMEIDTNIEDLGEIYSISTPKNADKQIPIEEEHVVIPKDKEAAKLDDSVRKIAAEVEKIASENTDEEQEEDQGQKAEDKKREKQAQVERPKRKEAEAEKDQQKKAQDKQKQAEGGRPKRTEAEKKKPETLLSPFLIRAINADENLTTVESTLAFYALHAQDDM